MSQIVEPKKFHCFLIGEGTLLIQCSEILLKQNHQICGIISKNELITKWAEEEKISLIEPNKGWHNILKQQPFDYLFSIYSFSLMPEAVLAMPLCSSINYHDALLPKYAGFNATSWAVMNGESQHGVSWHMMTPKADAGPIFKKRPFQLKQQTLLLTSI